MSIATSDGLEDDAPGSQHHDAQHTTPHSLLPLALLTTHNPLASTCNTPKLNQQHNNNLVQNPLNVLVSTIWKQFQTQNTLPLLQIRILWQSSSNNKQLQTGPGIREWENPPFSCWIIHLCCASSFLNNMHFAIKHNTRAWSITNSN